jgi:O-antigen/teichoic acid export membrane protein
MLLGIFITPFWSAFTEAWSKKDIQWIKNTMKKLRILWALLSITTLIMLIFANFIYKIWVGKEIVIPISISVMMAFYVIINAWNSIFCQFLNGVGKIKIQLYTGIIDMVLNIPMAVFLGKAFGVAGVILSSVILSGLNMIWTVIQYKKIIDNKAYGIWAE